MHLCGVALQGKRRSGGHASHFVVLQLRNGTSCRATLKKPYMTFLGSGRLVKVGCLFSVKP